MEKMTTEVKMALGRLFSMMARPTQDGDIETFHAIYSIVMDAADGTVAQSYTPNYARDRLLGAQGDVQ